MTEEQFNQISKCYNKMRDASENIANIRAMMLNTTGVRTLRIRNSFRIEFDCKVPEEIFITVCDMLIDYYTVERDKARKEFEER